jgi:hypothetical protein
MPEDGSFAMIAPRHRYSVGVIRLLLETVLSCAASQRTAAAILRLFSNWLPGVCETPCANTGRMWLLRLGLYELTRPKEVADDWAWIMDHTLQLGNHKALVIVGVRLSDWRQSRRPLQHGDLTLLNLTPMEEATGDRVYEALVKTVGVTGVPRQVLSDGGGELERGVQRLRGDHPEVARVYDVKHKMALLLKKELEHDPRWSAFLAEVARTRREITQTALAFLIPPVLKNKARYMNVDILVKWGWGVLGYLKKPRRNPQAPVDHGQLREKLGWLTGYRRAIQEWSKLLAITQTAEDYVRRHGYHRMARQALDIRLAPFATMPAPKRMRAAVLDFVAEQACLVQSPSERLLGHSEVLESLIGKYKHLQSTHSKGGMTAMLLSFGAIVSTKTEEAIVRGLTAVQTSAVAKWCQQNLGSTLQSQRILALPRNKNGIQNAARAA